MRTPHVLPAHPTLQVPRPSSCTRAQNDASPAAQQPSLRRTVKIDGYVMSGIILVLWDESSSQPAARDVVDLVNGSKRGVRIWGDVYFFFPSFFGRGSSRYCCRFAASESLAKVELLG